ncbi:MAG: ArsR/SmtB family transcription factor [Hyphomicrobiaceae bacterium]
MSSATTRLSVQEEKLDLIFRALGDRTRRELLSRLANGSSMVTELAKHFDMSLPAVGKHLRVLERAGLIQRTISGRVHHCSLNALPLKDAEQWLGHYQQFWDESLDGLITYVRAETDKE